MARDYKSGEKFRLGTGENVWPLFERVERALTDRVQTWGSGRFRKVLKVDDAGGSGDFPTIAEARATTTRTLVNVYLFYYEIDGPRQVHAVALNLDAPRATPKNFRVGAKGPDEPAVIGLPRLAIEEAKEARTSEEGSPSPLRVVLNHPWVSGIGTGVFVTVLGYVWSRLW